MKRADVDEYRAKLDQAVEEAQGKLAKAYAQMNGWPADQKRDALGDVFAELCRQYGDAVGVTASDFYELIRSQSSETSPYKPVLAPNVPVEQVRATYAYSAKHLYSDQPEKILDALNGRLRRFIEYTARETVHVNAAKDRARTFWARIPSGGKTCAWCFMLASRGWVYATEQTAGGVGNEFHDDDRCMIIPSFDDSPALAGYDPDAMYEKYSKARDEVLSDGLEPTDKTIAGRLREMFPDDFKDGKPQLKPSESAWNHILYGDADGGGHIFGHGPDEKTKAPETWDKAVFADAIFAVQRRGDARASYEGSTTFEGLFRGVMFRVAVRDGEITSAYPLRGEGVTKYENGARVPANLWRKDSKRYNELYETDS